MSKQHNVDTAVAFPKCPACGSDQLAFAEILGPAEQSEQLKRELAALKKEYEAKASQSVNVTLTAEDEAFLLVAADPKEAIKKLRRQQLEKVQHEFVAAKQDLINRLTGPRRKLAVIYCVQCGHTLGPADPPECREDAIERSERRLTEPRQSIAGLREATSSLPSGLQGRDLASPDRTSPHVRQTGVNEVVVSASAGTALELVAKALERVGKVQHREPRRGVIEGRIACGLQSVKVRASLVERSQGSTTVVIQASADDVWGIGAANATRRIIETLLNLDNPGYVPDRRGMHPLALMGLFLGFVILVILVMKYVLPLIRTF